MPLSEHEQRLLEQLEQQLHEEDRLPATWNPPQARVDIDPQYRGRFPGGLAGIIVLLTGISGQLIPIGVLGFAVMGAGVYIAPVRAGSWFRVRPQGTQGQDLLHGRPGRSGTNAGAAKNEAGPPAKAPPCSPGRARTRFHRVSVNGHVLTPPGPAPRRPLLPLCPRVALTPPPRSLPGKPRMTGAATRRPARRAGLSIS